MHPRPGQPITIDGMFGNDTISGFNEMKLYDVNGDNIMDAQDAIFGNLSLWRDINMDGVSTPDEISTMAEAGITAIDLDQRTGLIEDNAGNIIVEDSTATVYNQTRRTVDILFATDQQNTVSTPVNGTESLSPETLFLPHSRGYSTLPEWHVAMTQNLVDNRTYIA